MVSSSRFPYFMCTLTLLFKITETIFSSHSEFLFVVISPLTTTTTEEGEERRKIKKNEGAKFVFPQGD